jgi:hypothetical protein
MSREIDRPVRPSPVENGRRLSSSCLDQGRDAVELVVADAGPRPQLAADPLDQPSRAWATQRRRWRDAVEAPMDRSTSRPAPAAQQVASRGSAGDRGAEGGGELGA